MASFLGGGCTLTGERVANVFSAAGVAGVARAMPDDRVLVLFEDGRSYVVDAERLEPQEKGRYLLALAEDEQEFRSR